MTTGRLGSSHVLGQCSDRRFRPLRRVCVEGLQRHIQDVVAGRSRITYDDPSLPVVILIRRELDPVHQRQLDEACSGERKVCLLYTSDAADEL